MWYLVVPPIIVIASLALLVWFLSDRVKQPSIRERMEDITRQSSFREWQTLRFKQVFFRSLEKSMRFLKVLSLRVHNSFHTMGQSLREKRHQSDLLVTSLLNLRKEKEGLREEAGQISAVHEERLIDETPVGQAVPSAPRKVIRETEEPVVSFVRSAPSADARPMVSEQAVVPETKPNRVIAHDLKEEERLIKKIAANPKNVSAYEALGDYYLERGDVNDAKACYRQVLKLSPVHRMVKVKIRKLERLMEERVR